MLMEAALIRLTVPQTKKSMKGRIGKSWEKEERENTEKGKMGYEMG